MKYELIINVITTFQKEKWRKILFTIIYYFFHFKIYFTLLSQEKKLFVLKLTVISSVYFSFWSRKYVSFSPLLFGQCFLWKTLSYSNILLNKIHPCALEDWNGKVRFLSSKKIYRWTYYRINKAKRKKMQVNLKFKK